MGEEERGGGLSQSVWPARFGLLRSGMVRSGPAGSDL